MERKTLCIATRNTNKAREMAPVLAPGWEVKCSADYPEMEGLDEIAETGGTFLANATLKAVATSRIIADHVLADDAVLADARASLDDRSRTDRRAVADHCLCINDRGRMDDGTARAIQPASRRAR